MSKRSRTVLDALVEGDPEANRAVCAARDSLVGSDFDCFVRLRDAAQYHVSKMVSVENERIVAEARRLSKELQETK